MPIPNPAITRRALLKASLTAAAPYVVPASVLGAAAPSNVLTMGCIGVGRQGYGNMRAFLEHVRILAVCDVDARRAANAKKTVEAHYAARLGKNAYQGCDVHADFRDLVARPDIDTCLICTPDHWHVVTAIAASATRRAPTTRGRSSPTTRSRPTPQRTSTRPAGCWT